MIGHLNKGAIPRGMHISKALYSAKGIYVYYVAPGVPKQASLEDLGYSGIPTIRYLTPWLLLGIDILMC